jgi:hypothetical protein
MATIFLAVEIEDATAESMVKCLGNDDGLMTLLGVAIRHWCKVSKDKLVMIEPFRNGIVLSPDAAARALDRIEGWDQVSGFFPLMPEDRQVIEALARGLEFVRGEADAG